MTEVGTASGSFALDEAHEHRWVLTGEIDIDVHARFREVWAPGRTAEEAVRIDMTDVTFLDSSGLRILYDAIKASPDGEKPQLVAVPERARWIIDVTGLTSLFDFQDGPDSGE
ncbi:STAS domain-containing protein [Sanguibacter suaedae]|uniref:STAS domain-containing protein n=1 Tax=Sanguibacter suaedae TaxID=2795737 RepID=A0A934IC16_9MICO|nr:STAS domain-containing protein [Sanguibacter suaedae]MBI9115910.1 STAS domain-containing protein [Sanguibacter suaedae]